MRVALHSVLKPGHAAAYDEEHRTIPDDLVAAFSRLGIHDWLIWRSGEHLFHLVDCDDFDAAMTALDGEPANDRWQATIGEHVDHFEVHGDDDAQPMPLVWRLAAQRDGTPATAE